MNDRFLLHYCDPTNWRLRNMVKHPLDPGWEVGSYCCCHAEVRPKINLGSKVFDVVVKEGKGVVRSAFTITNVRGIDNCLYFDEFYFADKEPIILPGHYIQYRQMKLETWIKKYNQTSPWNEISEQYTGYGKGEKPKSIEPGSWDYMVKRALEIRKQCK